jgi:hypothetical protein
VDVSDCGVARRRLYKIYRRPKEKFTPELNWKILAAGKHST